MKLARDGETDSVVDEGLDGSDGVAKPEYPLLHCWYLSVVAVNL